MKKKLSMFLLISCFTLMFAGISSAAGTTVSSDMTGSNHGYSTSDNRTVGTNGNGMNNNATYRTTAAAVGDNDNDMDWGWLGLLGLIGLAGLRNKNRERT
ncbi:WGxxGxxG family protein [Paenibacillus solisilvae]|uniref:WGxxGxxG family protein n=1 Tax=Paenibacillus solisilvae TaxID=2486751 RepID=A0ABW0VUL7_9BACL